jgi:RimJ/RimL family protein N-acetyltransferase
MEKSFFISLRKNVKTHDAYKLIEWLENKTVVAYLHEDENVIEALKNIILNNNEYLLTYYLNQNNSFFMIDNKGNPIGFIAFKPYRENIYEIVIAIGEIALWHQGYGRKALGEGLSYAIRELKAKGFIVKIKKENIHSLNLFSKYGFTYLNENEKYFIYKYLY